VATSRAVLLAAVALLATTSARADDADPIVVRVGTSALRASDVTRRLAELPAFQLRALGGTTDEIRRRFIDTVLVPELLHATDAEQRRLAEHPAVRLRIRQALRRALVDSLRADAAKNGVPAGEVDAYYAAHEDEFRRPERILIWRILVDDEALARKILGEARGSGGPERFRQAAREHSVDAATKMRSGMLGFVSADGRTDVPQVQVDPALFAAAAKVKDGELVPEPVHEGEKLAVVWRRGTLQKSEQPLESSRDAIRRLLVEQRAEQALRTLESELRARDLKDASPELLDALPPEPARAPAPVRSAPPAGSSAPGPRPTDRGLR
jgi:peptidyl-prolyl cis-trans isomerase C